jgi:hypothetical protein
VHHDPPLGLPDRQQARPLVDVLPLRAACGVPLPLGQVPRLAEQQPGQPVRAQRREHVRADHGLQRGLRRTGAGQRLGEPEPQRLPAPVEDGREQVRLAGEVVVHGGSGDARRGADRLHGDRVEAVLAE